MKILIAVIPLLAGFLLDCLLGDPYSLPHPIRLIGRFISSLEKWVRCRFSSQLVLGGVVMSIIVLLTSSLIPLGFLVLCYKLNVWLGVVLESVLCYYMLAARCLRNESMKVYKAIVENDTEKAREAVSMIVGRDTKPLDRNGIIRAAVETVAENTSDGVTAPMLFMGLGGAPLGFFYKAANTMDSMIGYTSEKYLHIGRFAAKLDDVLNYIPSQLTALLMILSAGILNFDIKNAWKIWRRDRRKHASPNSAQTEAVCAGALRVRLAGDAWYFGELHRKPFIGDDIREIENEDIRRANRLMYCTSVLMLALCTGLRAILWGCIL